LEFEVEIKYVDAMPEPHVPVRKQVWNGQEFVPVVMYRIAGGLTQDQKDWLCHTFGSTGSRWNYSRTSSYWTADEQVFMMFRLRWGEVNSN